jgi:hypothetical protein
MTDTFLRGCKSLFDWLNWQLFEGRLPPVVLKLIDREHTFGYFTPRRYSLKNDPHCFVHEIGLKPVPFRDIRDLASTLLHEMVHLETYLDGKFCYCDHHDKHWATRMKRVGLLPTHTGEAGGRETGHYMDHLIVEGGQFDQTFKALKAMGWRFNGRKRRARSAAVQLELELRDTPATLGAYDIVPLARRR